MTAPLSTLLSQLLVAYTIEVDNEFEARFAATGHRARVASLVMWSNFMRFVGGGVTVGDLPTVAGLPKARLLSTLGGLERWGYLSVVPPDRSAETRREGWGSARALRSDWIVRPTPAGRAAQEIWPALLDEVDHRWEERFGSDAIKELRGSLQAIVGRIEIELPEYLPIVGGANGMRADLTPRERTGTDATHLSALLAQALLAYTLDYEDASELSLPLSANLVRVLAEERTALGDLPALAGISPEASSMGVTSLRRLGYISVEAKEARLTPKGRSERRRWDAIHDDVERRWEMRCGTDAVGRLRASSRGLIGRRLAEGLHPHPGGWRAGKRYADHTQATLGDPSTKLPHYPMVLQRGGWPDGS